MKTTPPAPDLNTVTVTESELADLVQVFEILAQWDEESKQRDDTRGDTLEPETSSPINENCVITSVKKEEF